jgi:hypothetical protein
MQKLNSLRLTASLTIVLILGSVQVAQAKFWGKEEKVIARIETPDGACREYYTEKKYIFWIKVSETGAQERPCS